MSQSRREFLSRAGVIGGVAVTGTVGSLFTARAVNASQPPSGVSVGYGPLVQDPKGVLDLPSGFEYTVVSRAGEALTDPVGVVPGHQDGTGSFAAKDSTLLVINHEQSPGVPYPARAAANLTYDPAATGGTTTVRVGETNEKLAEYVSLAGTAVNCAGGVTPWGTWLTCEETEDRAGSKGYTKDHGWVFEVDPHNPENNTDPVPLKDRPARPVLPVHPEDAAEPAALAARRRHARGDVRSRPAEPVHGHRAGHDVRCRVEGRAGRVRHHHLGAQAVHLHRLGRHRGLRSRR